MSVSWGSPPPKSQSAQEPQLLPRFIFLLGRVNKGFRLPSWLPNQMISLILIFGFLCRSSSWWLWPHIGWGRMVWPLLRPQMAVLDHFFCKICFWWVWRRKAFFWGHVGYFFGPWERFVKNEGGFPKRRGDFMLWSVFQMWYYETSLQSNTKTN